MILIIYEFRLKKEKTTDIRQVCEFRLKKEKMIGVRYKYLINKITFYK